MKKLLLILVLSFTPFFAHATSTMETLLQHMPTAVAQQQQFYVDVTIDPHGRSFNGVQGSVTYSSDAVRFVRAETGTSNVTLWIDQPAIKGNTLTYSGIIPGGFDGLIDPFDTSHKQPGEIVRLVFVGTAQGMSTITASNTVTDNDGNGTIEQLPAVTARVAVSNAIAPSRYTVADTTAPLLDASVTTDKNLYDGQAVLIFSATDKESGIDHVEVKEGNSDWSTTQSPFLLRDQSRQDILLVRAFDVAGNTTTVAINPVSHGASSGLLVPILLALIALVVGYVIYKKNRRNKNGH